MALLETLQDAFPGTTLDPKWTVGASGSVAGGATVGSGTLNLTTQYGSSSNARIWVASTASYQFTGSSALARVYPALTGYTQRVSLKVRSPGGGEYFEMYWWNSSLFFDAFNGGNNLLPGGQNVFYDQNAMAWWRIRSSGGLIWFDTSPDGLTWTNRKTATHTPVGTDYHLELGTSWSAAAPTATAGSFDNVNNPPPPPTIAPNSLANTEALAFAVRLAQYKLHNLQDDFTGTTLDTAKWTFNNVGTCTVSGGTLNLDMGSTLGIGTVTSYAAYQFTDSSFTYQLVASNILNGSSQLNLDISSGGSEYFTFMHGGTILYLRGFDTAGAMFASAQTTWDSANMKWWRLRAAAGIVYWETSPDNTVWNTWLQFNYTPASPSYTAAWKLNQSAGSGVSIKIDNVNPPPSSVSSNSHADFGILGAPALTFTAAALIATLTDDFNTGVLDAAKWTTTGTTTSVVTVSGGALTVTTDAGLSGPRGYIRSVNGFAAVNSSLYAKVAPGPASAALNTYLIIEEATAAPKEYLRFRVNNGIAYMEAANLAGTVVFNPGFTYDPVAHAWLRIRHTSGSGLVDWDTSPDGVTWTNQGEINYTPGRGVYYARLLTAWAGTSSASVVTFDNVNVAPRVENLRDDFSDPTASNAQWVEAGGVAYALDTARLTSAGSASITSVNSYYLDSSTYSSYYSAKITQSGGGTFGSALSVKNPTSGFRIDLAVFTSGNVTGTIYNAAGSQVYNSVVGTYNPVTHAYLRIRTGGGTVYFDASTDGVTWANLGSNVYAFNTGGTVKAYVLHTGNGVAAQTTTVDNVNITPYLVTANPAGIGETETLGAPAVAFAQPTAPDGIADTETLGVPSATIPSAVPDTITDVETLDQPELIEGEFFRPQRITDTETLDGPAATYAPAPPYPNGIADPETAAAPGLAFTPDLRPNPIVETETFDQPALAGTINVSIVGIGDTETLEGPYVGFRASTITGSSITDPETLGAPAVRFNPGRVDPLGIAHTETFGAPTIGFISVYSGAYNTGTYGVGPYQGFNLAPNGITDTQTVGDPAIYTLPPVPTDQILLTEINDGETVGLPQAPAPEASNLRYGAGTYNEGPYYGAPNTPTDTQPADNINYGVGTYGYGIYYGISTTTPPQEASPLLLDIAGRTKPPLHILGIGPWSPNIEWRGATNYGVHPGKHPSRPAMALPPASSKGFTLRLNDGDEARCDMSFPRGSAVILDEMDTDLWWRRKDPRTGALEMIGRFNVSHLNVSTSDTGVSCSVQLVDYRTILGERMALRYLHPDQTPPNSLWTVGTPIIEILDFALPRNTGLDMSEVRGDNPYDLGKTTQVYDLPPGTLISDVMDNLEAVSPHSWEWWIETPLDIHQAPKLRFTIGVRGVDKGVTLFDVGTGPTPIASWTRNSAADNYANALYYTGGGTGTGADAGGGVVEVIDAQVLQYGQRDVQDGNSSIGGNRELIRKRATRKLQKLADRRPTYNIQLKHGFWRGRHHIDVGDTITLYLRLGDEVLRDKLRVSEIVVAVDENGMEEVDLTLGRLPVSADPRSKRSPIARVLRYLKNYSPMPRSEDVPKPDDL